MTNYTDPERITTKLFRGDLTALRQLKERQCLGSIADTVSFLLDHYEGRQTSQELTLKITRDAAGKQAVELI